MATVAAPSDPGAPAPRGPALKVASRVALVQLAAAGYFLWREHVRLPMLLAAMAVVVVAIAVVAPRPFVWFHKTIGSVVGWVMGWVGKAAIAIVALPLLVLTSSWQRACGTARLASQNRGGWSGRSSDARGALYSSEPTQNRRSWRARFAALATAAVLAAGVLVPFNAWRARRGPEATVQPSAFVDGSPEPFAAGQSPMAGEPYVNGDGIALGQDGKELEWSGYEVDGFAHEDEPFAPLLFRELLDTDMLAEPVLGYLPLFYKGAYVNIANGFRRSYVPENPDLTVWFFGGSTMYGIGQRDDHTIASEVARLAERDGVAIEPVNFGVSSYTNWSATERFEHAITSMDAPDLVVFYDGTNDNSLLYTLTQIGAPADGLIERQYGSEAEREAQAERAAMRSDLMSEPAGTDDEMLDQAADQYRRGVDLGRAVAAGYEVPIVHFWQPHATSKAPHDFDPTLAARLGVQASFFETEDPGYDALRERSGVNPIDISDAMDGATKPVYFDWSHHNEYGATLVADAMYEHLGPQLAEMDR